MSLPQHDNTPPPPDVRLLTAAEVAALFRVNAKTPARWADAGRLTVYLTPGGHRRFLADEVYARLRPAAASEAQS